jgi:hypothetical protein
MQKKRNIPWPSLFLFMVAIVTMIAFVYEQRFSLLLQALGFICLGYSSIRLMPGDFFSRKLSLPIVMPATAEYRQSDVLIQNLGIFLVFSSLAISFISSI